MGKKELNQYYRPELETADREALREYQWQSLRRLLETVHARNSFYQNKWRLEGIQDWQDVASPDDFTKLPFTTRSELGEDQISNPPYGTNITWPINKYTHWHRTSGRKGTPLIVLSTRDDWRWYAESWAYNFTAVNLTPGDSLYIAFSFGPFAGLWGAVAGAESAGIMMIPGGGQRTVDRLHFIMEHKPTAIACIPTYAMRMAEDAEAHGIDLSASNVRLLIHGGEPGPSIPSTRARIEKVWNAKSYDTTGMTEVGHHGFECLEQSGVHMIESEVMVEVFEPGTNIPIPEGEVGEMVVTSLGRYGFPTIRYRTGDLVRLTNEPCECGRTFARLEGGILGRVDEMITVRGISVFPSAIEECLMAYPEISEYRVDIFEQRSMREVRIRVEMANANASVALEEDLAARVKQELQQKLALRADVQTVAAGSLPRPPGKSFRFVRHDD